MNSKQRTWGQFETPTDLADLLLGLCLRRPGDRVLDPSCGEGALLVRAANWQRWIAAAPDETWPDSCTVLSWIRRPSVLRVKLSPKSPLPMPTILPNGR
ncbi:MAG: N-6 DNA methylase [Chloroflexota bacterium]